MTLPQSGAMIVVRGSPSFVGHLLIVAAGVTSIATFVMNFPYADMSMVSSRVINGVEKLWLEHEYQVFLAGKEGVLQIKAMRNGQEIGDCTAEIHYTK